ncbi:unnamed protein product [Adineta steineri]|uniref:Uncharacterized protein n=1 Tax=Adineta steineri TaxID=433720 RepID=A0A815F0T4_9BILA|nr:unnamed protein product [Adineta steineri]CAF1317110.1 unnamed protein product [Adineta steineri]
MHMMQTTCKIFGFLNYFAGQSSAWLRVFMCFDRYLSASRLRRPWCSREKDNINLGVYNCIPFILMLIFNSGVIYHSLKRRQVRMIQQSQIQHRAISISLVIITFPFLIMTIPATIVAAFSSTTPPTNLTKILDSILYTYHITSFPLYLITFKEFLWEFIKMVTCKNNNRTIVPAQVAIATARTPNQL